MKKEKRFTLIQKTKRTFNKYVLGMPKYQEKILKIEKQDTQMSTTEKSD